VELFDVVQIVGNIGRQELERGELVLLEKVGQVGITRFVCAVHDRVVDTEVNLRHFWSVCRLERLLLDKPYNLLKVERVTIELAVQNRDPVGDQRTLRQTVDLSANVVHVRESLARAREETLARDSKAAYTVQLALCVARKLDVLATLVVVVGKHRVRNAACVCCRLGVLLGAWLNGLDALLVGVTRLFAHFRLLLRHTARLGLLLPVALRLIDRLLDGRCLILLANVLTHSDKASVCLEFAIQVAVGGRNRTDATLVLNFDRPHLDFTCRRLAVQGGKGGDYGGHYLCWRRKVYKCFVRSQIRTKHPTEFQFFQVRRRVLRPPR